LSDNQDEIKTLFSNILEKLNQIQETLNKIAEDFSSILENLIPEQDLEEEPTFTIEKPQQLQKNSANYIS
jgi:hypothetical protein